MTITTLSNESKKNLSKAKLVTFIQQEHFSLLDENMELCESQHIPYF